MAILGCVYVAGIIWLLVGLRRVKCSVEGETPSVSIIVAARNEERSISACLRALQLQDYKGKLEIVVVDDRSSDRTAEIANHIGTKWSAIRVVCVIDGEEEYLCPKKNALARGIAVSSGELLLFTDADCEPSPAWVRITVGMFADDIGVVAGYARPNKTRWLRHRVLSLENLAVSAMAAGSIGSGTVLSCTGRNLAYRKRVYDEVDGYQRIGHLIAGDDVYFARLVAERTNWGMAYCRDPQAVVVCDPGSQSWVALAHQKLRHASKAGHFRGFAKILGIAVYLFHLTLLCAMVLTFLIERMPPAFPIIWGSRWLLDLVLLKSFAVTSEDRKLIIFLPILEIVYIPYVLLFVPAGALGWFRWREEDKRNDDGLIETTVS